MHVPLSLSLSLGPRYACALMSTPAGSSPPPVLFNHAVRALSLTRSLAHSPAPHTGLLLGAPPSPVRGPLRGERKRERERARRRATTCVPRLCLPRRFFPSRASALDLAEPPPPSCPSLALYLSFSFSPPTPSLCTYLFHFVH